MKRFFSVAFFKDKKNIAILTLVVLLLGSFSAMGNQQKDEKEYKVQIQKLTKSNEEAAKDYKTLKNEFDSYKKENEQYIALGKKEEQTKKEKAAEEKKKKEAEKAKQEKEAAEKTAKEQEIRKQEEAAAAQAQQQQEAAAAKEAQQQERTVYVARNGTADVYWYNLDNMPRNTRFDRVVTMTEADAINAGKHHTSKE